MLDKAYTDKVVTGQVLQTHLWLRQNIVELGLFNKQKFKILQNFETPSKPVK